ncbi:MAG: hypothetical protein K5866_02570 [Treponema sp.]|nr:hypothetical protein [Treponema sp.]
MKKISLFFLILFSIVFLSCTSTKTSEQEPVEEVLEEEIFGARFIDWKYKGFGNQLPVWIDAAYDKSCEEVKAIVPELSEKKIFILRVDSETLDQAELAVNKEAESGLAVGEDIYILYERFWVMLAEEFVDNPGCPYTSLAIFVLEESGL